MLGLAGLLGFASLIYGTFSAHADISFDATEIGTALHFGLFWVALVLLGAPIFVAWGSPKRRYTLPTSSFMIVACPMVCSMVSMFVPYALTATALNLLFNAGWPISGPGLVAALMLAWLQAILWSTSNSPGLQLVSSLAGFAVALFGVMQFAVPGRRASGWYHEGIDLSHLLMFSLASLVCVIVGTFGFANLRRGGGFDVDRIVDWAKRFLPKTARATPFASPVSAQFWLEWTERGYILPVGTMLVGAAALLLAILVSLGSVTPGDSEGFVGGLSTMLLMLGVVTGIYLGGRSEDGQFGNFNGTRPLTDGQIANSVLASATVGILVSVVVWAVYMAAALFILQWHAGTSPLHAANEQRQLLRLFGFVTLYVGAVWAVICLTTSLFLAGKKVPGVVVCTVLGMWMAAAIGERFLISREAQPMFQHLVILVWGGLPPVCIAAAFVAGWWLKLISRNTIVLAAAIVAVMFAAVHLAGLTREHEAYLPVLWACSLTPAALAVAPLAVWWNRHR